MYIDEEPFFPSLITTSRLISGCHLTIFNSFFWEGGERSSIVRIIPIYLSESWCNNYSLKIYASIPDLPQVS